MSSSLDPDNDRYYVSPDLGPNYLQKLSADDNSRRWQGKSKDFNNRLIYTNQQKRDNILPISPLRYLLCSLAELLCTRKC